VAAEVMTYQQVMARLRSLGTAQNVKVYRRHGAGNSVFGVSFASLRTLQARLKTDHALARRLWASGNFDARHLAVLIADPANVTARELDAWAADLDNYVTTDLFVRHLVGKTTFAREKMERWVKAREEWVGRAGWMLLALIAMGDGDLRDVYFERHLARIEREIHRSKNRVRDAMNSALIAIGLRNPGLRYQALAAARRIGKVEVDHGETHCATPDARQYILKAVAHRKPRPPAA
jgi:3-methyladenine DNA glycosylase AlkD